MAHFKSLACRAASGATAMRPNTAATCAPGCAGPQARLRVDRRVKQIL
jgi:hypothetical protein